MRLTLLGTGGQLEVPMPGEKKGRARMIEAFERVNASRHPGDMTPLSARDSGMQVPAGAGSSENQGATPQGAEKGDSAQAIRREVTRAAIDAWNGKMLSRPGPRTYAELQDFYAGIADICAVRGVGTL